MNRRGFLGLIGLAPAAAVATTLPAPALTVIGIDGGSREDLTSFVVMSHRDWIKAEKARWRAVGILDDQGRFSPAAFAADYPTRRAMYAERSRLEFLNMSSNRSSMHRTPSASRTAVEASPSERPRGDS
jgi:hypothetical protein